MCRWREAPTAVRLLGTIVATRRHMVPERALHDLEVFAHDLASGRHSVADIDVILSELRGTERAPEVESSQGRSLLHVLDTTARHVTDRPSARRQFFHAARAFIAQRRNP